MPHPTRPASGRRLTPRSAGLLQKFFAFVGREPQERRSGAEEPKLQIVIAQLRFHLANARWPLARADEDRLRASLDSYVDVMKAAGQPSEQVVISLKRLLRDADIASDRPGGVASGESARLWDCVVGWCIQRYYFAGA